MSGWLSDLVIGLIRGFFRFEGTGITHTQGDEYDTITFDGSEFLGGSNVTVGSGFISIGTDPSTGGILRVPNATVAVAARNSSDDGDLPLLGTYATNNMYIGSSYVPTAYMAAGEVRITAGGTSSSSPAFRIGGTYATFANGAELRWRNGSNTGDTQVLEVSGGNNLYVGSDECYCSFIRAGSFMFLEVDGYAAIKIESQRLGFFGAAVTTKPVVTGSTVEARQASLLAALSALGLIDDQTT